MWDELGLAPTRDVAAIRRAYAARLKIVRPDEDPAGFSRLRAAYEAALALASHDEQASPKQCESMPDTEALQPQQAGVAPVRAPLSAHPIEREFAIAFGKGDVAAAADALDAALRSATMPIEMEMRLSAGLVELLVKLPNISAELLARTASRFGWLDAKDATPATTMLQARIAAENWFVDLRRQARSPTRFLGMPRAGSAALLLGRGGFVFSRLLPPQPPLLSQLSELQVYLPWLAARFDPKRIEKVHRLLGRMVARAGTGRYDSEPRWPWALDRASAPATLLSILPAVAVGMAFQASWAGFIGLFMIRMTLARWPQCKRPMAIFGTLSAIAFIVFMSVPSVSSKSSGGALYMPSSGQALDRPLQSQIVPAARMQAARAGDAKAMRMIGEKILLTAIDPRQTDYSRAWLTVAANLGDVQSMFDLDSIYMNGDGLLYDLPRAYFWSGLAVRLSRGEPLQPKAIHDHNQARKLLSSSIRSAELDKQIKAWRPQRLGLPNY